jgi:undecaprenyl-phosphate 4-deoxy-4-formamido-L-arabinose transferase
LLTATGLAFSGVSLLAVMTDLILYAIHSEFFILNSVLILLTFFSGLILTSLGIVGEYIGRIFMTQSGLPQYVEKMVVTKES